MKIIGKIIRFLADWNELLSIPVALLIWAYSGRILRLFDPVAATFDSGIFQLLLFAVIAGLFLNGIAWLLIKLSFPGIYIILDNDDKEELTPWQKSRLAYLYFALYLVVLVWLATALA